jgi:hypothetical protein
MSPQKHRNTLDGPGASHENRRQPERSSTESEKSIFNPRARTNGRAKHTGDPNVDQQGNRANVR